MPHLPTPTPLAVQQRIALDAVATAELQLQEVREHLASIEAALAVERAV